MTGYTRKDIANNISDGSIINADDLDNEFDGVQAAFHASTGHTHDGTAAEGAAITKVGPVQDVLITTAAIYPKTTNTVDLGTSSLKYKDAFIAGNETVGGTLAVTGVATLTAQPVLSSLTASQAVFTDASKGLVSNAITGTGNVVMSTSPTLVTPILGTPASGTVTNLTGTASININGTVGATTPAAGVFTTLGSTGTANFATGSVNSIRALGGVSADYVTLSAEGEAITYLKLKVKSTGSIVSEVNSTLVTTTTSTGLAVTGTLSATGTVTLSSGTANGVAYLDGSKVLTTGSALTFDGTYFTVGASSTTGDYKAFIQKAGGELLGLNASSGTLARIAFGNATASFGSTQIIANAADLAFITNSAEQMRLTSTGLGIGTSTPTGKVTIAATYAAPSYSGNGNLVLATTGSRTVDAGGTIQFGGVYTGSSYSGFAAIKGALEGSVNAGYMAFYTEPNTGELTERMRLDSAGNLGIGTSSPASLTKLTVFQDSTFAVQLMNSSQNYTLRVDAGVSNALILGNRTSFTDLLTISTSGNLGLGVTPSAWSGYKALQIGAGTADGAFIAAGNDTNVTTNAYFNAGWKYQSSTNLATMYKQTSGTHQWYNAPSGTAGAAITFTQAMTLDASGNLLVGTTTTSVTSGGFVVQPNGFGAGATVVDFGHITGTASGTAYDRYFYNGSVIGSITQNGTTGVLYNTSSDYRLKDITGPITTSGAYIDSLNPVEGTWKADGSTFVGLIAHETQEASRTTVATGTKDGEEMQGMDYSSAEIIANLIAEIQSLRKRLTALEAK